jgi:anaerobic magnesium-protoporphyrin IX monomethyl ester cyclase
MNNTLLLKPEKVLLVYPGSRTGGSAYPMGILYIAQALRKINIEVSIFHMGTDNIKDFKPENYLFVGISMLTDGPLIRNSLCFARLIKNFNSQIPIVIGGVHPTLLPEQSLQNDLIDFVVVGEGEKPVQELALRLQKNEDISDIKGLGYKDRNGNVTVNPEPEFLDMETELDFDIPYELLSFYSKSRMTGVAVHTSRGCPYRCGFCYNVVVHDRKYRFKSSERVLDEIEYLYKKYSINTLSFTSEDEFFIYPKRVYEIMEGILQRGIKIEWFSFCRFDNFLRGVDKIGPDFIKVLKKSGCKTLTLGSESGSQRILDEIVIKDSKVEHILRGVEILKKAKIPHQSNFICGYPTETQADFEATLNLIEKINFNNPYISTGMGKLIPVPGSSIYDLLISDYGYIPPSSLEEWGEFSVDTFSYKDMSWLSPEHRKTVHSYSTIAKFPYAKDFKSYQEYKGWVTSHDTGVWPGYIDYLVLRIQGWRYKNKYFKFMIEAPIYFKFFKLRKYLGMYLLRKILPHSVWYRLKEIFYHGKRVDNHTEDFKKDAVTQVTDRGHSIKEVSSRLGVSRKSLFEWIKQYNKPESLLIKEPGLDLWRVFFR